MTKKYNLGSTSDMRRFTRDLENQISASVENHLYSQTYDVTCPHCNRKISVPVGKSRCPFCGNDIDLNLNIGYR